MNAGASGMPELAADAVVTCQFRQVNFTGLFYLLKSLKLRRSAQLEAREWVMDSGLITSLPGVSTIPVFGPKKRGQ